MKSILYIGNKLQDKTSNSTSISILGPLLEFEGYSVFYSSSKSNKLWRMLDMLWSVLYYCRQVDRVLIDTYSTQNFYFALSVSQLCRVLKLDYIPVLRGGDLPKRLKNNPKLSALVFKKAKCNISPSMYLKQEFESRGYDNIIHISNTLQISDYPFSIKNFDVPRLLWVRSFSKIYNPKLAIHVFKNVKKSFPGATLCMIGPDADGTLSEVKSLAQQFNLEVEFTGKLSKKEWIVHSKQFNIFINTTNFDNTPISVIEAMALGLPIVSTNVGGMPYLIENNVDGILVAPNDINSMAAAIDSLIENTGHAQILIKNARRKAETFDWQNVKKLWFSVLEHDNSYS